jgi:Pentapeptide repeats (8 copies)/Domain of unknown function (DUF4190)
MNEFSKSAIASLVLGAIAIASLLLGLAGSAKSDSPLVTTLALGSILAIVFGVVAKKRIKAWEKGNGMATAGLVLGIAALVLSPVLAATTGVWEDRCGAVEAGADLSGCDLSGEDLSGEDLRDANLTDADLADADLTGARLQGSRGLESANLVGARGLDDKALAAVLGVSLGELPTYLASHGTLLEPAEAIGKALAGVCKGTPLPEAAARPNGTLALVGGHHLARGDYRVPDAWRPMARRYISRVACLRDESKVIGKCTYTGGVRPVVREFASLTVRDARSGAQLASKTFTGRTPLCTTSIPSNRKRIVGPGPAAGEVTAWLGHWRD